MVGIPGRSKGCNTCRRRKIRCDLARPFCSKCTLTNRVCEGYARYPVFLNRTQEGPQKRYGLEEAKAWFTMVESQSLSQTMSMQTNVDFQRGLVEARHAYDNRMLMNPDPSVIISSQVISAFWGKYLPLDPAVRGRDPCVWLQNILSLPKPPSEVLLLSLRALAMTRLGWVDKNEGLGLQGNQYYGRALQVAQKALYKEQARYDDELFAAGYVLTVYELFESTTPSIAGWNSHVTGLGQLIQARGPEKHKPSFARGCLEEFRTSAMIQGIQFRSSSFLNAGEWLTIPWQEAPKDVYQQLYDKGFALGALLEDIDQVGTIGSDTDITVLSNLLQRAAAIDRNLDDWYERIREESPHPLYWHVQPSAPCSRISSSSSSQIREPSRHSPFTFHTARLACIVVTSWALKLALSVNIALLCKSIISTHTSVRISGINDFDLRSQAHCLLPKHGDPHRMKLATNIMRSMPYTLNDNMGLWGPQKSLFALRVALAALRGHPGEDLKWCQRVYQELDARKGIRYAREIAKVESKWTFVRKDILPLSIRDAWANEVPAVEPPAPAATETSECTGERLLL